MKAIIFDMDGVLIDSEAVYFKKSYEFLAQENLVYPKECYLAKIGSSFSIFSDLADHNPGISTIQLKEKFAHYWQGFSLDYPMIFRHELSEILPRLKKQGFKLSIASSSPLQEITAMAAHCKIADHFDVVLSGRDLPESKPNPAIFLQAAQQLAVAPRDCLVIEDSHNGILAAVRAGMKVIALKDPFFAQDVAQADQVIEHISQLEPVILSHYL